MIGLVLYICFVLLFFVLIFYVYVKMLFNRVYVFVLGVEMCRRILVTIINRAMTSRLVKIWFLLFRVFIWKVFGLKLMFVCYVRLMLSIILDMKEDLILVGDMTVNKNERVIEIKRRIEFIVLYFVDMFGF